MRSKRIRKRRCTGLCRDCGEVRPVRPWEFWCASPPRCYQCGALVDKQWVRSPAPAVQRRIATGKTGRPKKAGHDDPLPLQKAGRIAKRGGDRKSKPHRAALILRDVLGTTTDKQAQEISRRAQKLDALPEELDEKISKAGLETAPAS